MADKRTPLGGSGGGDEPNPRKAGNPFDQHVGARVRMRRLLLGMSQEKLGTALNLTFQQVQKYEKGTNRIGASRLKDIARILGVPPAFFFDGAASEAEGEPVFGLSEHAGATYVAESVGTAEGLMLNRAFARIADARLRRRVVDLVVAMAESQPPLAAKDAADRSE